jgi:RES domain
MIATPVLERTETADELLRAAHRQAYLLSETDLIGYLKRVLGRPLIAHVTGTADANNVSRWASGRARPDRAVWERLRTLATLHIALTAIVGSESSSAQWFTGQPQPRLQDACRRAACRERRAGFRGRPGSCPTVSDTVVVTEFWRVGRRADPLRVGAEYQGAGRFDDPERLIAVLYGAPALRTCLLEFLFRWKAAPSAGAVLGVIPEPTDEEEAVDAARDHALAIESRRVPPMLYDRVAVHVGADPALALLDLHSVAVRERLGLAPAVAHELRYRGFAQLDRGALLAPQRALTQTVTGAVLRGDIISSVDGLFAVAKQLSANCSLISHASNAICRA